MPMSVLHPLIQPFIFQTASNYVNYLCLHQELRQSQRNQQAALEKLRSIKEDKQRELMRKKEQEEEMRRKEEERKRQEEERRRREEEEEAQRYTLNLHLCVINISHQLYSRCHMLFFQPTQNVLRCY